MTEWLFLQSETVYESEPRSVSKFECSDSNLFRIVVTSMADNAR